jgi:hypothetical protein
MEQRLNKAGDRRGIHNNYRRGATSKQSKKWVLYRWDEEVGVFSSLSECAEVTGCTKQYMWMLARERAVNLDGPRKKTREGWSIKPAVSIEFSGK